MNQVTNTERAQVAERAARAFGKEQCPGEDLETMAADLVTNLCHMLRLTLGMDHEAIEDWLTKRYANHNEEARDDPDFAYQRKY